MKGRLEANEDDESNDRGHRKQEELYGNMLFTTLAGFDITAYAMIFSMALLAVNPEVQD